MVGAAKSGEFPAGGIRSFGEAMDALAEQMCSFGFPQTLYTHIETPRQPDGAFNPERKASFAPFSRRLAGTWNTST